MKDEDVTRSELKGSRNTWQREAILDVVKSSDGFLSAQDIFSKLRAAKTPVGLTTVYRHLQILKEDNVIDSLKSPSGETLYRLCVSEVHHHHIVCNLCGYSDEIEAPEVEKWVEQTSRSRGFTQVSHTVEIYGLCDRCSKTKTGHRRSRT